MPATTEYHTSSPSSASSSFSNFGRSLLSIGRDHHVHSMEPPQRRRHHHEATSQELELDAFQRTVADRFHELSAAGPDDLLSLQWLQRLLDTFLCCQEEFRVILFNNKGVVSRAPMDRLVADFFERSVKALDVCNAIRDGIELIKQWQKQLEIVLCALDNQRCLGEGQFRRAKKSLIDLAIGMLDERETNANPSLAHRNRSFGRSTTTSSGSVHRDRSLGHFRSLSWSVSRTWSAARQLQAIGNNLVAPKVNEVAASNGLANAVFTMNSTLLFVMWALVAAIPCQDRGLQTHFNIPRHFVWAGPLLSLHDRIFEESKRRERKNSCGLLREIQRIEKCARQLNELADFVQFPLTEEKERDVRERVKELKEVYEEVRDCLDPLERRVREVFHTIVRSRTEGLDTLG